MSMNGSLQHEKIAQHRTIFYDPPILIAAKPCDMRVITNASAANTHDASSHKNHASTDVRFVGLTLRGGAIESRPTPKPWQARPDEIHQ